MIKTVDLYDFRKAFEGSHYQNNFSYKGLEALFNYITDLEEDCGIITELDITALACEYSEYDSIQDVCNAYSCSINLDEDEISEMDNQELLDHLRDYTEVIEVDGDGVIIRDW